MRERSVIGGYRIVKKIGSGGMSTVYKAIDADGRDVALKLLHPELAADQRSRARLRREVAMLQRVRGPYVARILDAETDDDEVFIVTELIDGPTLDQDVRDSGRYEGADLVELGEELAAALSSIHDMDILHRDLKPSNVMMGENGPVLIDFGIAQLGDDLRMTQTGSLTHTPGFCDPAVIRGGAPDNEADWWALAAVLAFAATGRAPFGVGNSPAVMHRILVGEADLPGLSADVERAFRSALSPRREDRMSFANLLTVLAGEDYDAVAPVVLDPTIREPVEFGEAEAADPTAVLPVPAGPTAILPAPTEQLAEPPLARTSVFDRPEFAAPLDGYASGSDGGGVHGHGGTPNLVLPGDRLPAWAVLPRTARLQVFAASVVVVIFALAWPMESAVFGAVAIVMLSWLGGAQRDLRERRMRNGGPFANDVVGAVLRSPWMLAIAILRSVVSLAVGVAVGWATAASVEFFTTLQPAVASAAGVYVAIATAWFMGTNSNGREGARYLMEGIAPTAGYRLFWFAITLVVAMAAGVVVSQANISLV